MYDSLSFEDMTLGCRNWQVEFGYESRIWQVSTHRNCAKCQRPTFVVIFGYNFVIEYLYQSSEHVAWIIIELFIGTEVSTYN